MCLFFLWCISIFIRPCLLQQKHLSNMTLFNICVYIFSYGPLFSSAYISFHIYMSLSTDTSVECSFFYIHVYTSSYVNASLDKYMSLFIFIRHFRQIYLSNVDLLIYTSSYVSASLDRYIHFHIYMSLFMCLFR